MDVVFLLLVASISQICVSASLTQPQKGGASTLANTRESIPANVLGHMWQRSLDSPGKLECHELKGPKGLASLTLYEFPFEFDLSHCF